MAPTRSYLDQMTDEQRAGFAIFLAILFVLVAAGFSVGLVIGLLIA